jgi:signal transduction histidine kinase
LVSPIALGAAIVVSGVAVVGALLVKHADDVQSRRLLQDQTEQAALVASGQFDSLGSTLGSLATAALLTGGDPVAFDRQSAPFAGTPLEVVLARHRASSYVVVAGTGFKTGAVLDPATSAALAGAGASFGPTPVSRREDRTTVGLAVGPPAVPAGEAVYMAFTIDPFTAAPTTEGRPFELLNVALYGSSRPEGAHLVVATTRALPLSGSPATATVTIGTGKWVLLATARHPLLGTFADVPWIVLGLGAFAAILMAAVVEVLARRQRYATALVRQRTVELVASQEALIRSERLSAMGEMATVIGHELRNPLAAVTNAHYLVEASLDDGDATEARHQLGIAGRETARAANLAEDLTVYMRQREPDSVPVRIAEVVDLVLETMPPPLGITVVTDVAPLVVLADDRQIHQILSNLVSNAYQAMPDGGTVRVVARADDSGGAAEIAVEDSGGGFAEADLERVFDPFFTTKTHGTGLGLSIVRQLAEGNGGAVAVENFPGGARVAVRLRLRQRTTAVGNDGEPTAGHDEVLETGDTLRSGGR